MRNYEFLAASGSVFNPEKIYKGYMQKDNKAVFEFGTLELPYSQVFWDRIAAIAKNKAEFINLWIRK